MVVGDYAVAHHGYPRPTGDLGVWVAVDPANAERIHAVLVEFGFGAGVQTASDFLVRDKVIRMGVPPVRIEVLTGASGVSFDECETRKQVVEIDGVEVSVIHRDDLLKNKRAAGRHKDLNDIEQLGG